MFNALFISSKIFLDHVGFNQKEIDGKSHHPRPYDMICQYQADLSLYKLKYRKSSMPDLLNYILPRVPTNEYPPLLRNKSTVKHIRTLYL